MRGTGVGAAVAIGRIGSFAGPLMAAKIKCRDKSA